MADHKMVLTVELDDKMRLVQTMMENKVLCQAEQLRLLQRAIMRRNHTLKNLRAVVALQNRASQGFGMRVNYAAGDSVLVKTHVMKSGVFIDKIDDDNATVIVDGVRGVARIDHIKPDPRSRK